MPRLFLPTLDFPDSIAILKGQEAKYLNNIMRLKKGDTLEVMDELGNRRNACVASASKGVVSIAIDKTNLPPLEKSQRDIWLVQGLMKGSKMDLVVKMATELGISGISPAITERAIVKDTRKLERWRTIAREAARQSGRADVPTIHQPAALPDCLSATQGEFDGFIFWEQGGSALTSDLLSPDDRPVVLAVGPEGGFSESEVEAARAAGFKVIGLGSRILRAETASIAAVTLAQYLTGALK